MTDSDFKYSDHRSQITEQSPFQQEESKTTRERFGKVPDQDQSNVYPWLVRFVSQIEHIHTHRNWTQCKH